MTTTVTTTAAEPENLENAWAGQGAVLLDIGGDVGALVVAMPASMVGIEVEIRPVGGHDVHDGHQHGGHHDHGHEHLAHVAVVARPVPGGLVPSLVFGDLEAGEYELFEKGYADEVALRARVTGGAVTSADWQG